MQKLSNGVSNYEDLIRENRVYIDKTMYIEKMESLPDKALMFLRPRKFGKTLFTSVLENYYDKNKANEFDFLFKNTYIGKNPTQNKNSYCILRFNFSGIDTENAEATMKRFKEETIKSANEFKEKYDVDFNINIESEAESILNALIKAFYIQKNNEKIYVIIDGYDQFAREILELKEENSEKMIYKSRKVRYWYEILKEGTETVVDRIFITGEIPITLDGLTSGFNIGTDISLWNEFNDLLGFTEKELKYILKKEEIGEEQQEKIISIMRENYGRYRFNSNAKNQIYNPNIYLCFLYDYMKLKKIPDNLEGINYYNKIKEFISCCNDEKKIEILKKMVEGNTILVDIVRKFNPEIKFDERYILSMLYYLGYLTISGEMLGMEELRVPNKKI